VSAVDAGPAPVRFTTTALGTSALLLVTDPAALNAGTDALRAELVEIDRACSRFRRDSEVVQLERTAGRAARVSPLLASALDTALRAAELTDGLVDPTVGQALCDLGYDRDFAELAARPEPSEPTQPQPAPGWWRVGWDASRAEVVLPRGVTLDLGATAKALAADRAAHRAAALTGSGVLVSLGGDIAMVGPAPAGGWLVAVGDDHRTAADDPEQTVALAGGGLATSSTTVRRWMRGGTGRHHIIDPRTGANPEPVWRTVSVAAASCVDANTASTAAVVLGPGAPDWLAERGLPARLVGQDERVVYTAGWPSKRDGD
jgi:thiamine biosynthesis lipoprotein